ncbi:helix-turn-helix transcriptional regulator [Novosphingobium malaysiense]|uniref:HTH luxR-type domain-containing protein n=1 Tax=Novosphingobium malaysiense TaxID=1348853 RepID=A0A0B1ZKU3_9SPHN|nr:helix-turn-helix transcriptional regulator [Novosphingobium malaysiense]KHK89798.1 hypothetical protein LK12_17890 [Novosphingobium malaysiense]
MTEQFETIPDRLASAIYSGIQDSSPWQAALATLQELTRSDWVTLRMISPASGAMRSSILKEAFVGEAGSLPDVQEQFLKEQAAEFLPTDLALNDAVVTRWSPHNLHGRSLVYYQQFAIDTSLSTCVESYEKTKCVLQFTRSSSSVEKYGRYTEDDLRFAKRVSPHFGRALDLKRKLGNAMITSDYQASALDNLGVAGFLITPDRIVHSLNELAETLVGEKDGLKLINNRLVATDKSDDVRFQKMLNEALCPSQRRLHEFGLTFAREGCRHGLGVVVKSRPYRSLINSDEDYCALVFVRKPESLSLADLELIQQMFDFTPAEARIAIHLARGQPLDEIEQLINIRHNTARAHLRSIYQKAEVSSMAQLIHLLASRTIPVGRIAQSNVDWPSLDSNIRLNS